MRLEEFSDTAEGIRKELRRKGYKFLGAGVDQSAYLEPGTGYVLKVFGTQCSKKGQVPVLSPDQKMFKLWANFCAKNQQNPFLPRIYGYDTFVWDTKQSSFHDSTPCLYLQIRTEPLKPIPANYHRWFYILSEAIEDGQSWKEIYEELNEENIPSFNKLTADPEGVARMAHLYKTMQTLYKMGNSKGFSWDLHTGNVMMRNDGTLVINDPWVL